MAADDQRGVHAARIRNLSLKFVALHERSSEIVDAFHLLPGPDDGLALGLAPEKIPVGSNDIVTRQHSTSRHAARRPTAEQCFAKSAKGFQSLRLSWNLTCLPTTLVPALKNPSVTPSPPSPFEGEGEVFDGTRIFPPPLRGIGRPLRSGRWEGGYRVSMNLQY